MALPPAVDLRAGCSAVEDQLRLGSCTGNALVGAMEYRERRKGGVFQDLSRLFVYYNERALEGTVSSDSGAAIRDGIKVLAKLGVCREASWPYNTARFAVRPPGKCYTEALGNRVGGYYRVDNTDVLQLKTALANGLPFVFGFSVYSGFEGPLVAKTGVANTPGPGEAMLGGHAVMAVGYDDATQRFTVRNSWGPGWGQAGYFTMPYTYLTNPGLADDFWVIT